MNVLIIYAHHEPSSFTAALKNLATQNLMRQGHTVVVSDLYGEGFNPVAQKWDFVTTSGGHFNYMLEQKHAAHLDMAFSPDIVGEIQKVKAADMVFFVAPLWGLSVPAILKGWFDRVMAMGITWDTNKIFENGLLKGKQAMLVLAAGGPEEYFTTSGRYGATPQEFLHPINQGILAFSGLNVHAPFVALNVLGMSEEDRNKVLNDFQFRLDHLIDSPEWLIRYS